MAAQSFYSRAAARITGEYGAASGYGTVARSLADKPPSGRASVEKAEMRRTAACNWVEACGLAATTAARWSRPPIAFHMPPSSSAKAVGTSVGSPSAALDLLSAASQAILRGSYVPGGPNLLESVLKTAKLAS